MQEYLAYLIDRLRVFHALPAIHFLLLSFCCMDSMDEIDQYPEVIDDTDIMDEKIN